MNRNGLRWAEQLSLPGDRHAFAERLDYDVLKASLDAEQKTKRFREPEWSVALSKARLKKGILTKWLSMHQTGLDHSQILRRDMAIQDLEMTLPVSKEQCKQQLRDIQAQIKKIVAESYLRRDQEREERIQELKQSASTADKNHAKLLRRLKRNENKVNRVTEKIKAARERGQRQGVTRIEIPRPPSTDPKTCTEWQTIDVPSEIVEHLQRRNRQHFGQAHGTPFTVAPLSTALTFCGDTGTAESILDGTYPIDQHSESVQLLLQHLQQTHQRLHLQNFRASFVHGKNPQPRRRRECISVITRPCSQNINTLMSHRWIHPSHWMTNGHRSIDIIGS